MINLYNSDCLSAMAKMPDKAYDLAIVDPPYGIGMDKPIEMQESKNKFGKLRTNAKYKKGNWDTKIPDPLYFTELFRVSKHQIICGGNYFTNYLYSTNAWIFWDKKTNPANGKTFSDGEMIWTSFSFSLRKFVYGWIGFDYINNPDREIKIHPTQKPTKLYEYLLRNYAKKGDKILDTHLGSGSIAIACHNLGFDLDAYEIDKDYYEAAMKRFDDHKRQGTLFTPKAIGAV